MSYPSTIFYSYRFVGELDGHWYSMYIRAAILGEAGKATVQA